MSNSSYVQIGPYPNVLAVLGMEAPIPSATEAWESISGALKEFLSTIAPKYIGFTFKLNLVVNNIVVEEGANGMGVIHFSRGDEQFRFTNPRIRAVRERGDRSIRTTKVSQAVKTFHKYFYAVSPTEAIASDISAMNHCVFQSTQVKRQLTAKVTQLFNTHMDYIVSNWEVIGGIWRAAGLMTEADMEAVLSMRGEARTTEQLRKAYNDRVGYNVHIKGDYYYVHERKHDTTERHTIDTLPDNIKRGVGILKMVPDDTFVDGVGVRRRGHSFYVLGDEQWKE